MIYLYRCEAGHEHDLDYPIGQAPASIGSCPTVITSGETGTPIVCDMPLHRIFTVPYIVHGPGMVNYSSWGDKVQKSVEGQERFGRPGVPLE